MISSVIKFRQLNSWVFFSILAFIALLSLASCDKKEDPNPAVKTLDIAGVYTLKKATLNEKLSIYEKGADITALFKGELFSKITCKNENNLAIDLRKDKSLYVSCVGESNDLQGGTWNLPHNDTLVLSLNDKLVKAPFALTITDVKVEDGKITGNLVTPMEVGGNIITVKAHIEFHPFKEGEEAETPDDSGADLVVGLYTLKAAVLNEDFLTQKKGEDITATLESRLLGKVACGEDTLKIIELRKDKSIYVRCQGISDGQEGGTWSLTSSDTLVLTLNDKLVDGLLPAGVTFPLTVTNLKVEKGKITGNTMLPVPGTPSLMSVYLEFHLFVPET